jgi:hypothetical protein
VLPKTFSSISPSCNSDRITGHESFIDERVLIGPAQRFKLQLHAKLGPLQSIAADQLHVMDLGYRGTPEPRILRVSEEILGIADEDPDALPRNIQDLNV